MAMMVHRQTKRRELCRQMETFHCLAWARNVVLVGAISFIIYYGDYSRNGVEFPDGLVSYFVRIFLLLFLLLLFLSGHKNELLASDDDGNGI